MVDAVPVTHPAGWYDDPQNPAQQRYWDGGRWTEHQQPRQAPPAYPGQYGGGFGYAPQVPSTPDGVALSGWWKRVAARILDGLIVQICGLPLTGYFLFKGMKVLIDWEKQIFDDAVAGKQTPVSPTMPPGAYKWLLIATAIGLMLSFAYEYFFLTRSGSTPGKKILGISVRLREVPGPPPGSAVLKRFGLQSAFSLLALIPVVGTLFSLGGLLDDLWPLWDDKKQALHDKVGETNVVVGAQPPRR